ncbi:3149_t:CDS:2 [Paraglomus brasilianum]|uniref:3149_t:CDS:1 n=1 Tax=Paraglomus brasilianum TaxID=144538 RepID=A0A9N8ZNA8_9GLOM|nr:3149_t:CDS:2 [Paraglomus brasilianum]
MSIFRSIKPAPQNYTRPSSSVISPKLSIFDFIDTLTPRERSLVFNPPYDLKISLEDLLCSTRQQQNSRTKKNPPRAPNAWILFRKSFANEYRAQNPDKPWTMQKISTLARDNWNIQSNTVKEYFATLAKLALQRHRATYPNYLYQPRKTKQDEKNQTWLFREVNRDAFVKNKNDKAEADSENGDVVNESCSRGKDTPPIIKDGKIKQLQNALFVKDERRRFIRRIKEEDTDKASPVIFLLFYIKKRKEKNPPA